MSSYVGPDNRENPSTASSDVVEGYLKGPKYPIASYTPEMSGSGQRGICVKCGMLPSPDGHDGCLGLLPESVVMNACCGHGEERMAYVQYWNGACIRGKSAIEMQKSMISERDHDSN